MDRRSFLIGASAAAMAVGTSGFEALASPAQATPDLCGVLASGNDWTVTYHFLKAKQVHFSYTDGWVRATPPLDRSM